MMKVLIFLPLMLMGASIADAATLTLPSFTVSNPPPPSTAITCTETSPIPFAPVAVGTALWSCTVAPSNWLGTVTLSGGNSLTTSPPNGNLFSVVVGPTALSAGTYVPGTITATP
jgi:hypothetical protein